MGWGLRQAFANLFRERPVPEREDGVHDFALAAREAMGHASRHSAFPSIATHVARHYTSDKCRCQEGGRASDWGPTAVLDQRSDTDTRRPACLHPRDLRVTGPSNLDTTMRNRCLLTVAPRSSLV